MTKGVVRHAVRATGRWPLTLMYVPAAVITFLVAEKLVPSALGVGVFLVVVYLVLAGHARHRAVARRGRR